MTGARWQFIRDRFQPIAVRSIAVAAISIGVILAAHALPRMSVTIDEFGYLPHGLAWLSGATPRIGDGNPPLSKVLAAAPVAGRAVLDPKWVRDEPRFWPLGRTFMRANAHQYHDLFLRARLVPLAAFVLTCLLVWRLATGLYGAAAGAAAATLTSFDPNVIAHGTLVTPDIFFTAAVLAAVLLYDRNRRHPSPVGALATGAAIGLACDFKASGLLVAGLFAFGWLLAGTAPARSRQGPGWRQHHEWLLALLAILFVINLGYLFEGSLAPLGSLSVQTPPFVFLRDRLPWVPSPVPLDFVRTLDLQLGEGGYPAYLNGQFNTTGFHTYYLFALLFKTPLPVLALVLLASLAGRPRREEGPIVGIALMLLVAFSAFRFKNIGVRYVLVLYPLMHVWAVRLVALAGRSRGAPRILWSVAVAVSVLGAVASEATTWPYHLPYFNVLAGGSIGGTRHLLDSNVDWGQDLVLLREFQDRHRVERFDLAYGGRVDPAVYGIRYDPLVSSPRHRWAAISVNLLFGRPYLLNGTDLWPPADAYAHFRDRPPASRLGYSLYVFDLAADPQGEPDRDD